MMLIETNYIIVIIELIEYIDELNGDAIQIEQLKICLNLYDLEGMKG